MSCSEVSHQPLLVQAILTNNPPCEHASLNALHAAVPTLNLCPQSHAHGPLRSSPNKFFLATDFLDLNSPSTGSSTSGTGLSLAAKLAALHTTPAPIPPGFTSPMFGFPVPTCCGPTRQDNTFTASWAEFYAEHRLRSILREGSRQNGPDGELAEAVERVAASVVPRLLGDEHLKGVVPVVVHGDLWSGNHGRGRIGGKGGVEEVVYDPSCVYGHSEYELGIMRMFGGFGRGFWSEYESLVPKAEPKDEWEDRVSLYELWVAGAIPLVCFRPVRFKACELGLLTLARYHHLNHYAIFGGGYRSGAMSIMRKLISKYGNS